MSDHREQLNAAPANYPSPVAPSPCGAPPGDEPQWRIVLVFLLMCIGLYVAAGPLVRLSEWRVAPGNNHSLMEARAWRGGRLDIPPLGPHAELGVNRPRDTAYKDGKIYNVFPPLFTFLSYAAMTLQDAQGLTGGDAAGFYAPWYVGLAALPLPLAGFWAFRRVTGRSEWAAVMTAYWILGTPLLKMLVNCRMGEINELNHVLSNAGLMLIAGDLLGRRRIWPAALGLLIGAWTRQLTICYGLGAAWIVWTLSQQRIRHMTILAAAAVVALGATAVLNALKFGNPLDNGYLRIYEGRGDMYATRARQYGLFSAHFLPDNAFYLNLGPPEIRLAPMMLQVGSGGTGHGTSIWLTSPLLLFAFVDVRRWWRDPARRALMLSSLLVIFGFLCYHNTGSVQHGFYRFALDFVPVWLMVIAPYVADPRRRWITVGCLAYSALYFHVLCATSA